jgi:CheY-like chemotaxis protein
MDPMKTPSPLRILLVEDDEHDRIVFRRAFQKSQVTCEVTDCILAEEVLGRLPADLLLLDPLIVEQTMINRT